MLKRRFTTGQTAKKLKPYRFEDQLLFLQEHMDDREMKCSIGTRPDNDDGELDNDNEEPETLEMTDFISSTNTAQQNCCNSNDILSASSVVFAKPTRLASGYRISQPEAAASTLMNYTFPGKEVEEKSSTTSPPSLILDHPVDCFLFGIASTLKTFPPYLQNVAKTEIFSTVQKLELQTLQQLECRKTVEQTSQLRNESTHKLEPLDDNSSSQDAESVRDYTDNF